MAGRCDELRRMYSLPCLRYVSPMHDLKPPNVQERKQNIGKRSSLLSPRAVRKRIQLAQFFAFRSVLTWPSEGRTQSTLQRRLMKLLSGDAPMRCRGGLRGCSRLCSGWQSCFWLSLRPPHPDLTPGQARWPCLAGHLRRLRHPASGRNARKPSTRDRWHRARPCWCRQLPRSR